MLTLLQHTTDVHPCQFSLLEAFLEEPFPQTPNELFQLEQRLSAAAAQVADHIVLLQLTRRWRAIRNHCNLREFGLSDPLRISRQRRVRANGNIRVW